MTKIPVTTRRLVGLFAVLAMLTWALPARAGTYLASAALLLDESRRSDEWMQWHYGDVKLADLLHQLSEARVKCGRKLLVPKEADTAHPHLLLALEASERAMAAALDGQAKHFLKLVAQAHDEARMFRAILSQQNMTLPDLDRKK
jgi:hypothetical protein